MFDILIHLNIELTEKEDVKYLLYYIKINKYVSYPQYYIDFCKKHLDLLRIIYGKKFVNFQVKEDLLKQGIQYPRK